MTQEEIIEGNRLIAEFMGWRFEKLNFNMMGYFEDRVQWMLSLNEFDSILSSGKGFKYHTYWDKLMPVVEKIKKIATDKDWHEHTRALCKWAPIRNELGNVNLENVWYCVVKFIHWYNTQKQQP